MPDLDIVAFWCCSSVLSDEQEVPSADGSKVYKCYWEPAPHDHPYSMWWTCGANDGAGCWPWRKNKTCRHTKQAEKQHCGWDTGPGIGDTGDPVEQEVWRVWCDHRIIAIPESEEEAIRIRDENARADVEIEGPMIEQRCPRCGAEVTAQRWGV